LPAEQETQTQEYIEESLTVLDRAQRLGIELERGKIGAESEYPPAEFTCPSTAHLPPIPIPRLRGKLRNSRISGPYMRPMCIVSPLVKLIKFNYLVTALRGNAQANYDHAIQLLKDKYGDQCTLINNLQSRLESLKAENATISAQRRLLEQILPVITQLEDLGVFLNGSFLTRKLLAKFSPEIQRRILKLPTTLE
ncbi:hypothetical protein COOONC_16315, partial [Cooperia oncophora]